MTTCMMRTLREVVLPTGALQHVSVFALFSGWDHTDEKLYSCSQRKLKPHLFWCDCLIMLKIFLIGCWWCNATLFGNTFINELLWATVIGEETDQSQWSGLPRGATQLSIKKVAPKSQLFCWDKKCTSLHPSEVVSGSSTQISLSPATWQTR